jgi:sigma-B regulation protein RsbU (phosphoserine phosphatase)
MNKARWQYAVLGILLLWSLLAQLTFSAFVIYLQAHASQNLRIPFATEMYTKRISEILPGYEKSGLQINDEVLALNGELVLGEQQLDDARLNLHVGETLHVRVRRTVGGAEQTLTIPVQLHKERYRVIDWATVIGLFTFLPLSCILLGFYIAFARPRDPLAWITLGMLASFGQLVGNESVWAIWSPWRYMLIPYQSILGNIWPLWMVLFALRFPVPFRFVQRHGWIRWALAAPFVVFAAVYLYGDLMAGNHVEQLAWLAEFTHRTLAFFTGLSIAYACLFFLLLVLKGFVIKASDFRRRLNVMIAGCFVSIIPTFPVALSQAAVIAALPLWADTLCLLMLIFFPLTMAYVIVVERAMDVRMVVRTGVRYAVANAGIRILRLVLIAAIAVTTLELALRAGHRWHAILIGCAGAILLTWFRRLALSASHWMDRRFFREEYDAEIILTELSNSVAGMRDTKALLETVTQRIADSLHVPRMTVLLEAGGRYQPAYALGFNGSRPPVQFPRDAATVRLLDRARSPQRLYFDDPQSWVHGIPPEEGQALRRLDAQLLLPVSVKNQLLGLMVLGPKKSEAPYSKTDLQLLSAVASQTGLALENARLTEAIRREIAQRERLDRELEIAREVQQRLFPQTLPVIQGLDFAGYCRPALGVGGDYYDFLQLADGSLGIAVGDVAGKGIAAALMMASLQASLRGQTIKPCSTLAEMIHHMNRLVYEASAEERYATFFYGQYEPCTREFRYVNAGHNPPLVYRSGSNGEVLRLEEGGMVIGLLPDLDYAEGRLELAPGDVIVAFTDGVSEAMNRAEEEFGEKRLLAVIRTCASRSAADILNCILEEVDRFAAGAPQHDDVTLVVARVQ